MWKGKPENRPERSGDQPVPVTEDRAAPRPIPVARALEPAARAPQEVLTPADQAEERFRALAEHARDSIAEITPEGKFLYVNPAFTEISGFQPGEVLGGNALDLVHPDDLGEVQAIRDAAFAEESPAELLFRSRHRDGRWLWVELAGRPYRTESGELRGVLVSRDVTGRVDAERALQDQLQAERRINVLSRRLLDLEPESLEAGLREGLGAAAAVAGADRAQFYFVDAQDRGVAAYYQWNAPGIPERDPGDLAAARSEFRWSSGRLLAGEVVHLPDLAKAPPEAAPERESLMRQGARSFLAVPIVHKGRALGFLDFLRIREERGWALHEISRLQLVADAFHNTVRRLRAERRRRESEERLRVLTHEAQDTICELSIDGRVRYLSPNFEKLCGYARGELSLGSSWQLVHPEDRRRVRLETRTALDRPDEAQPLTYRIRHRDGSWRWLEASVRPFCSASGERRVVVVVRDVTERQAGQLDLERRLELERRIAGFSRSLLERSTDGVEEGIRQGLELAAELVGADRAYLVTALGSESGEPTCYDWEAPGIEPRPMPLGSQDNPGQPWFTEQLLRDQVVSVASLEDMPEDARAARDSLEQHGIRSYLAVPINSEGRLLGVLGFHCLREQRDWSSHDVTVLRLVADLFTSALRRKRAESRLRESQLRLLQAQKMEAIGTLAGGIAHDFNNQLTVMLANARFARTELGEASEAAPALDDLTRAAEHCAQLTRSLLAFSRRAPASSGSLDAARAVARAQELLRPLIPSSIRFDVEVAPRVGSILCDDTQLQQVLVNLVVNARDAMPGGGTLSVRVTPRDLDEASAAALGLDGAGRYVEFFVRDTGVGMDAQVCERIFEPFFTTKAVGRGTGLGLSTAYGIVQQYGGAIQVESERGRGSTFRVFLRSGEEQGSKAGDRSEPGAATGSGLVLLAEDEESVRRATARMLRAGGYEVLAASDGAEALRLGRQNASRLAALVTDVDMPRLDGVGLARRLLRERPSLPVLFISGTAPEGVAVDLTDPSLPVADFVAKPFTDSKLLDALHQLLRRD